MQTNSSGRPRDKKQLFISGPLLFVVLVMLFICGAVIFTQYTLYRQTRDTADKWTNGWNAWRSGDARGALNIWPKNDLAIAFSRNPGKFYYWRIRALEKMGRTSEAAVLRKKLFTRHPFDYYSFLLCRDGGIASADRTQIIRSAEILYRRPWPDSVAEASRKTGVPDFCIWAVMRRESKFQPDAVSRSGAVGLMQLMPDTANALAQSVGITSPDLELPHDNILMGSSHIKQLAHQFNGSFILAVAAYNAGAASVRKWGSLGARDWAEWIENIPYPQTREFVRCVMSNREMYRMICGSKAPTLSQLAQQKPLVR